MEVSFSGSVTADRVDLALPELARLGRSTFEKAVVLDFSEASFTEPPALQCVVALVRSLKLKGTDSLIRVPRKQKVRDAWKRWRFDSALGAAVGIGAEELFVPEDHGWFVEEQRFYKHLEYLPTRTSQGGNVESYDFFEFNTTRLDRSSQPSARPAYLAKDAWNSRHIQDILLRKIGQGARDFAAVVVFEAILNATRHPRASIIQTAAFDQPDDEQSGEVRNINPRPTFTVHFWDDGQPMADKLLDAIRAGVDVRTQEDEEFRRTYLVRYSDGTTLSEEIVGSNCPLNVETPPHIGLLATLFPSVSSSPKGEDNEVPSEIKAADPRFANPGMGLFLLINNVVEILGGTVAFRTSHYFMNVRRTKPSENAKTGALLRVKIHKFASDMPFLGNMITVRVKYSPPR
jgi:hypothetical protein